MCQVRCSPLKSQKPSQLVERKFALFQMLATCGREVDICPLPHSLTNRGESFYRQSRWGGLHAETAQPSLIGIHRVVLSGLTSVFLVVSGTVFSPGCTCPISLRSVLGTGAARVLVQPGHH